MLTLFVLVAVCFLIALPIKLALDHYGPLKPCRHCRAEVSKQAPWCPKCGGPNP
jgi:ribosomal protein L40E